MLLAEAVERGERLFLLLQQRKQIVEHALDARLGGRRQYRRLEPLGESGEDAPGGRREPDSRCDPGLALPGSKALRPALSGSAGPGLVPPSAMSLAAGRHIRTEIAGRLCGEAGGRRERARIITQQAGPGDAVGGVVGVRRGLRAGDALAFDIKETVHAVALAKGVTAAAARAEDWSKIRSVGAGDDGAVGEAYPCKRRTAAIPASWQMTGGHNDNTQWEKPSVPKVVFFLELCRE